MAAHNAQKAEKLSIEDISRHKLSGGLLQAFDRFLGFLKSENIRLPWKSINGFKMTYKGQTIGAITLGAGGWLDNAIEKENHVLIHVYAYGGDFDEYLEGQSDEIIGLFMERIENKCIHCRPTCGCSRASGRTVHVAGRRFENVCNNAPVFSFDNAGCDMREMTMNSPCAVYPPIPLRPVQLETVKNLILARKAYIERASAVKNAKVPLIEQEIRDRLDGDLKEAALGFVAWLNGNQLSPRQWFGPGYWRVPYGGDYLCGIVVDKGRFRIWFFKGDYSGGFDEAFAGLVHDHVRPCTSCTTDCQFGKDMIVFGSAFENTCFQFPIQFENPDGGTLEAVKMLIEYWKTVSPASDSWHVR